MNEQNSPIITTSDQQNAIQDIQERFESIQDRGAKAELAIQNILPVSGLSPSAQELFMLAMADCTLLVSIVQGGSGMNLEALLILGKCPDGFTDDDDYLEQLREKIIQDVADGLGVDRELVVPTMIKIATQTLELVETVLVRIEANLASVMAAREQ